jgi:predicted GNAT family N-acyltransferase
MKVKLANSQKEYSAAYHIRYECLCKELGDDSYASHTKKTLKDKDDHQQNSRVFVAYIGDKIVGTARLLLRKEHPFIADDFYDYKKLAAQYTITAKELKYNLALIDRVCILKEYRGHNIFRRLYENTLVELNKNACQYLIAAVKVNNLKSQAVFEHFGFSVVGGLKRHENWQGYLYCIRLKN